MRTILRLLAAMLLALTATGAHAAITCTSVTTSGFTTAYVPNTTVALQLSFTITCNRGSTTDPTTLSYSVKADNGRTPQGNANRASLSLGGTTSYIFYDVYTPSCAGTQWKNNVAISGTVTWSPTQTGNSTDTQPYWACIVTAQNPTAAGTYTDSIGIDATYNPGTGNAVVSGTIPVTIYAPANCLINPAPSGVSLVYNAFSAVPVSGTTTFGATCTSPMPYSLAVSPATGTLSGVNYNVTLNSPTGTGTGALQTYTITVTAPAGQAGTCAGASCTATQTHTLTVTY